MSQNDGVMTLSRSIEPKTVPNNFGPKRTILQCKEVEVFTARLERVIYRSVLEQRMLSAFRFDLRAITA